MHSALTRSPSPKAMEMRAAAPLPTNMPNEVSTFMNGKVNASPDNASGPTPCPMKMRSTMLNSDITTVPVMAGRE